ncbi:MAG: metal-dependent transcriptional regulator [Acidobacteria bacterium]|nr:metal-dependent transcriptional regulator [Acidobacteriota bacterium]
MSSESIEDYIKAIFKLSVDGGLVQTSAIADRLDVRPASVSNMMRRLATLGLLHHEPYRGVQLTDEGEKLARRMIRRHRLIERFLVEILEYPWDEVHEEAERLEHAVSPRFVRRLDKLLESPATDPHGAPIPSSDGTMDESTHPSLVELGAGETAWVRRVRDNDGGLLREFGRLGLRPDAMVEVVESASDDGLLVLRVGGEIHRLEYAAARGVFVERTAAG